VHVTLNLVGAGEGRYWTLGLSRSQPRDITNPIRQGTPGDIRDDYERGVVVHEVVVEITKQPFTVGSLSLQGIALEHINGSG
jgi:hypothetical protein